MKVIKARALYERLNLVYYIEINSLAELNEDFAISIFDENLELIAIHVFGETPDFLTSTVNRLKSLTEFDEVKEFLGTSGMSVEQLLEELKDLFYGDILHENAELIDEYESYSQLPAGIPESQDKQEVLNLLDLVNNTEASLTIEGIEYFPDFTFDELKGYSLSAYANDGTKEGKADAIEHFKTLLQKKRWTKNVHFYFVE